MRNLAVVLGLLAVAFIRVSAACLYVWSRFHEQRPLQELPAGS